MRDDKPREERHARRLGDSATGGWDDDEGGDDPRLRSALTAYAAADDEEMTEYIRQLEENRDTVDSPEASGDAIAQEFEQYLRRRGDGPSKPGRDDRR